MIMSRPAWSTLALFIFCCFPPPAATAALSLTPSTKWYGDDGSWSAISIRVGSPPQWMDVMVDTVSSETWVIGPNGCDGSSLCASMRGGLFNKSQSTSWQEEGFFDLSVDGRLGGAAYAQYGLDDLTFGTTDVVLPATIIGVLNTTEYWTGNFGVGNIPGNFTNVTPAAAISALAQSRTVPSQSYGYTAGASYQQKGETISLTLGGYDANRFVPHDISFELNASEQLELFVQSISVVSTSSSNNNWSTPVQLLSPSDRVSAIIDSSTPYLWLPPSVCDRISASLGLSYNATLNIYAFDTSANQHDVLTRSDLTFTFALSDLSTSTNIVNITLPYAAFDLELSYPSIPNTTYNTPAASKYYFPIRQAAGESQYTIGRSFLQEAYIITNFELHNYSVHQAVHIANPIYNTSIVSIPSSTITIIASPSHHHMAAGAIAGLVMGVMILLLIALALCWFLWRKRRANFDVISKAPPRTLIDRLLFRRQRSNLHEVGGSTQHPVEVGADATHERYELAATLPVELESISNTLAGTTEHGSGIGSLERHQTGKSNRSDSYPPEKTDHDMHMNFRPPDIPGREIDSPLVSPMIPDSLGSANATGQLSPVSPGFTGTQSTDPNLNNTSSPPPSYSGINPANVVFLGRLPDNVQLPPIVPLLVGRDGRVIYDTQSTEQDEAPDMNSTLGSAYTEEENRQEPYGSGDGLNFTGTHDSDPRAGIDGAELVHIPQPAENRFSWEEERVEGRD